MKKFLFALVAIATILTVSCGKDDKTDTDTTTSAATSLKGRWDAPRFSDAPEDIAFVAIFGEQDLDLYVIAWGQHMKGTYTWSNNVVKFNITEAYNAFTDVTFDGEGHMTSWSWNAGNLDATTLTLAEGYDWYAMNENDFNSAQQNFGEFEFNVNGATATSTLVGIPNLTFHKVQ